MEEISVVEITCDELEQDLGVEEISVVDIINNVYYPVTNHGRRVSRAGYNTTWKEKEFWVLIFLECKMVNIFNIFIIQHLNKCHQHNPPFI